jgi:two-component system, OmpR family, phosphate regulon response regulator OmpR
MMPGESGLSLARDLKLTRPVPICMLTALAEAEDRISGLEAGVDDYVSKPFDPRELLLRVRNILRRGQAETTQRDEIRMGGCIFNIARGELKRDEEAIKLTERERDLLRFLNVLASPCRATSCQATTVPAANAQSTCRSIG